MIERYLSTSEKQKNVEEIQQETKGDLRQLGGEIRGEILGDIETKTQEIMDRLNRLYPGIVEPQEGQDNTFIFTDKIQEYDVNDILETLFNNENLVFEVDYQRCDQDHLKQILGSCYYLGPQYTMQLVYHKEQNTFSSNEHESKFQLFFQNQQVENVGEVLLVKDMAFSLVPSLSESTFKNFGEQSSQKYTIDISKTDKEQTEDLIINKEQLVSGINNLQTILNNYLQQYPDDENCMEMIHILGNTLLSLSKLSPENIGKENIIKNVINPFLNQRINFKKYHHVAFFSSYRGTSTTSHMNIYNNSANITEQQLTQEAYNELKKIFFGTFQEQQENLRIFGETFQISDKTHTSFLADEIMNTEQITIKSTNEKGEINNYQEFLDKLQAEFNIDFSGDEINEKGEINPQNAKIQKINRLYKASLLDFDHFTTCLRNEILPKTFPGNTQEIPKDSDLGKGIDTFKSFLTNKKKKSDSFTREQFRNTQEQRRLYLQKKSNKNINEELEYAILEYSLTNTTPDAGEFRDFMYNSTKNELLYGEIGSGLKLSLFSHYAQLANGVEGINADIYNNIQGLDGYISDENAKLYGDIGVEIAICIATIYLTGVFGNFVLDGVFSVGKAIRYKNLTNIAQKAQNLLRSENFFKGLSLGESCSKICISGISKIIEAPFFNNVHEIIESGLKGTPCELDPNPASRNNIQTAAFLCVLGASNKLFSPLTNKLGTSMKDVCKTGLDYLSNSFLGSSKLVVEAGAMIGAEEVMNLTFGYETLNPKTGEIITERGLRMPTKEELVQILGIILGSKAVKNTLWQQIAEGLKQKQIKSYPTTDPNIVIFHNTKTNEFIIAKTTGEIINKIKKDVSNHNTNNETGQGGKSEYFPDKISKYNFSKEDAENNSTQMDERLNDLEKGKLSLDQVIEKIKTEIETQYMTKMHKTLELTEQQILSIIYAHEQDGTLGEHILGQLHQKVKILDETITDEDIRRFLLEGGFCGKKRALPSYREGNTLIRINSQHILHQHSLVDNIDAKQRKICFKDRDMVKNIYNQLIPLLAKGIKGVVNTPQWQTNRKQPGKDYNYVLVHLNDPNYPQIMVQLENDTRVPSNGNQHHFYINSFYAYPSDGPFGHKIDAHISIDGTFSFGENSVKVEKSTPREAMYSNITPAQIKSNNKFMNNMMTKNRNLSLQNDDIDNIRRRIQQQYRTNPPLTNDQIIKIFDIYRKNGGSLTKQQSFKINQLLATNTSQKQDAITDDNLRKFLLNSGFFGEPSPIKRNEIKEKGAADLIITITEALESENAVENLDKIFNDFLNYIKENKDKENFKQEVFESLTEFFNDYQYIIRIGESYNQIPPTSVKVFSNKSLGEKFYQLTGEEGGTCKYRSLFFKDFFDQINTAGEFGFRNIIMYENTPGHSCVRVESDIGTYMIDRYYDNAFAKIEPQNFSNTMKDYFRYFYDKENYSEICQEFEDVNQYLAAADKRELIKYGNNRRFKDAFEKGENDIPYDSRRFSVTKNNKTLKFRDTPGGGKKKNIVDIIISEDSFSGPKTFGEKIYDQLPDKDKIDVGKGFGGKDGFINYLNTYIDQEALKENFHETWNKNSTTQETSTTPFLTNKLHRIDFKNIELNSITPTRVKELFGGKKTGNLILVDSGREDFYGILENLKRLNCFDKLMLESIKENKNLDAREVKIPLGSEDGSWIKVTKDEILNKDKRNLFQGTFGDRLLEVAFLKQQFLNLPSEGNEIITNKQDAIKQENYVELTTDNFRRVGESNLSNKDLLGENAIDYTLDSQSKENFFDQFNPGSQMVELKPLGNTADEEGHIFITPIDDMKMGDKSLDDLFWGEVQNAYDKEPPEIKEKYKDLESYRPYLDEQNLNLPPNYIKDIGGYISDKHVYLLTGCKTINGEKRCFFVDVQDTSKEFNLSLGNASKLFHRNVEELKSDHMFDQSRKQE